EAEVQDTDEQEGRTGEGVDEELERGLRAFPAAPLADDEVARDERQFEEDEELEYVVRDEAAHREARQQQHPRHEGRLLTSVARAEQRQQDGERREYHHQ